MKPLVLLIFLSLSGCAFIANTFGLSANAVQVAQVADASKLTVDVAMYSDTGKTVSDQALSIALKMDCQSARMFHGEKICQRACS